MEEIIETVKALVSPINKLIDVVQCGIGKAYEPTHIKRMAKAKANEIKTISEAMNNAVSIPMIYEQGNITADTTDYNELMKRTQLRLLKQEVQKQENIENIIGKTYLQLESDENINSEPLDSDWINRFFNYAGDISNEKMQELWGGLLAGEIKRPSTFSLRTLETLHNLTQKEAELFQKMSSYFIYELLITYLPNYSSLLSLVNINLSDILKLDELGLINSSTFLSYEKTITNTQSVVAKNLSYALIAQLKNTNPTTIVIKQFPITAVGKEILTLIDTDTNNDFFKAFSLEIKRQSGQHIDIQLKKIISINKNTVTCDQTDLLATK